MASRAAFMGQVYSRHRWRGGLVTQPSFARRGLGGRGSDQPPSAGGARGGGGGGGGVRSAPQTDAPELGRGAPAHSLLTQAPGHARGPGATGGQDPCSGLPSAFNGVGTHGDLPQASDAPAESHVCEAEAQACTAQVRPSTLHATESAHAQHCAPNATVFGCAHTPLIYTSPTAAHTGRLRLRRVRCPGRGLPPSAVPAAGKGVRGSVLAAGNLQSRLPPRQGVRLRSDLPQHFILPMRVCARVPINLAQFVGVFSRARFIGTRQVRGTRKKKEYIHIDR